MEPPTLRHLLANIREIMPKIEIPELGSAVQVEHLEAAWKAVEHPAEAGTKVQAVTEAIGQLQKGLGIYYLRLGGGLVRPALPAPMPDGLQAWLDEVMVQGEAAVSAAQAFGKNRQAFDAAIDGLASADSPIVAAQRIVPVLQTARQAINSGIDALHASSAA